MKHKKMKRRNFIKAGLGTTVLSIFGLKQLFSASRSKIKPNEHFPKKKVEKQMEIFLQYGGEFSGVKPQLPSGRANHGSI
jgi:hypothetical protein